MSKKIKEIPVAYDKDKKVFTEYINNNPATGTAQSKWWNDGEDKAHQSVTAVTNSIIENQTYKEAQNLRYARLYANAEMMGFGAGVYDRLPQASQVTSRVSYNVVKSCIDTAASRIAKMRPRIVALTSGGSWNQQKQAEKLAKFIEGTFYEAEVYANMSTAFIDACIFGTGAVKFYHDGEHIKTERVLYNEILVDSQEAIYGKPRQLHQIKYLSRDVLMDMFPEHAQKISMSQTSKASNNSTRTTADLIQVRESWHLKSGKNAKDGKHCMSIENCTLFMEDYKYDYFPFIFQRWSKRVLGFEGSGIAEELIGLQIEINKLLRNIQQAQNLACVPRVMIETGSQVSEDHITNQIGSIIKYTGTAPQIVTASAMPGELYNHLETLFNKAYQIVGISGLSANSQKPVGLESAVALREFQDIETERFSLVAQMYEDAHVELGNKIMDIAADLAESNPKYKVKVPGSRLLTTIKWSELDIAKDDYILQLYPASLLPTQPAGRLQKVQELLQAGMVSQVTAKSLLNFPDIEDAMDTELAAWNDIHMVIEEMMETDVYSAPEPFMDPPLCIQIAQSQYLRAKTAKVEEEKLELLRRFIEDSAALIRASEPAQVAEPATAPAPLDPMMDPSMAGVDPMLDPAMLGTDALPADPMAIPEEAPVSDLMPIV